jgi:UDP-GlcNAc:undecaprenyl-phosphate GlcNAc-1-phosphate transferase
MYVYEFLIAFLIAFIVAFSFTPIARKIAFKIGAIDIPKDERRMHNKPIARLGGLAIVAGFAVAMVVCCIGNRSNQGLSNIFESYKQVLAFTAGSSIIVAIGIIDDVKRLGSKTKLFFQLVAAIIIVIADTRIGIITNPFSEAGSSELPHYISYPITVIWIVGITNAINLIDGLDGLAAGVSSISSLSLMFVSIIQGRWDVAAITAALAGATLGFLPYNFNPAKIFMGDNGATFLGFTLGVISIQGMLKSYATIAIAIPLLVLGLPLFDTIFAIVRRLLSGKPIMQADRGHLHHKLIDMGLSQRQSVVIMYMLSAVLGLCAIILAGKGAFSAIIVVLSVSIIVIGGARYMTEINKDENEEKAEKVESPDAITGEIKDIRNQ